MNEVLTTLQPYLIYFLVFLLLLLLLGVIRYWIKKYFEVQTIKAKSMSYPMILAVGLLMTGFLAVNSLGNTLIELLVSVLNNQFQTTFEKPNQLFSLIAYVVFAVATIALMYIYYAKHQKDIEYKIKNNLIYGPDQQRIVQDPPEVPLESPIFYERIRQIFHLKYADKGLYLEYDERNHVLFGEYKTGYRTHQILAFCQSAEQEVLISREKAGQKYAELQELRPVYFQKPIEHYIVECFYLLELGSFESVEAPPYCFSEDEFLQHYIDFSPYLRDFVRKVEQDRLPFSNVDAEKFNNTLAGTFIQPKFNDGEEDLPAYLDNWLKETGPRQIALLGDYGTGKTSFLKHYTYTTAKKILRGEPFDRIPVFISLTRTSPMHAGIKAAISNFLAENRIECNYPMFEKLIHRGKVVFILDGFDEMGFIGSHEQRFDQLNAIWQLATKGNKIIISGRPSYFPTEFEEREGLNLLSIEEAKVPQNRPYCSKVSLDFFDEPQIESSIETYYKDPTEFQRFITFIKGNQSIYDLCKRASLLHLVKEMLPYLYNNYRSKELNPAQLMQQYTEHWVERQLGKSIVSAVKNEKIKKSFVFDFFCELAGKNYNPSEGNVVLTLKDIQILLKEKLRGLPLASVEETQGFESEILTGYFIERQDNVFRFVHKSFMEYFVAKYVIDPKNKFNNSKIFDSLTLEIIDYLYYLTSDEKIKKSIKLKIPFLIILSERVDYKLKYYLFLTYLKVISGVLYVFFQFHRTIRLNPLNVFKKLTLINGFLSLSSFVLLEFNVNYLSVILPLISILLTISTSIYIFYTLGFLYRHIQYKRPTIIDISIFFICIFMFLPCLLFSKKLHISPEICFFIWILGVFLPVFKDDSPFNPFIIKNIFFSIIKKESTRIKNYETLFTLFGEGKYVTTVINDISLNGKNVPLIFSGLKFDNLRVGGNYLVFNNCYLKKVNFCKEVEMIVFNYCACIHFDFEMSGMKVSKNLKIYFDNSVIYENAFMSIFEMFNHFGLNPKDNTCWTNPELASEFETLWEDYQYNLTKKENLSPP